MRAGSLRTLPARLISRYRFRDLAIILSIIWVILMTGAVGMRLSAAEDDHSNVSDFLAFYAASTLLQQDTPEAAYDLKIYKESQQNIFPKAKGTYDWFYPPPTFLLIAPLAWLPVELSYLAFELLGLAALLAAAYYACANQANSLLPCACACSAWASCLAFGQIDIPVMAAMLMGFGALTRGLPLAAGFWFGLMILKPQYGVLLPVAFLAAGQWRVIAATAFSAATLCFLSLLLFGADTWEAFFNAAMQTQDSLEHPQRHYPQMTSPFALIRQTGLSFGWAWGIQAISAAFAIFATLKLWAQAARTGAPPTALPLAIATLCLATHYVMPWTHSYNMLFFGWQIFLLRIYPLHKGPFAHRLALFLFWFTPITLALILPGSHASLGAALFLLPVWLTMRAAKEERTKQDSVRIHKNDIHPC